MNNRNLEIVLCILPLWYLFVGRSNFIAESVIWVSIVSTFSLILVYLYKVRHRWQLFPCYLAYALNIVDFFIQPLGAGNVVVITGIFLFSIFSLILVMGLPVPKLPKPLGDYRVGTVDTVLVDRHRSRNLACNEGEREIAIKIWYPALCYFSQGGKTENRQEAETFWSSFIADDATPKIIRYLLKYLNNVPTSSYPNVSFNPKLENAPVILYCSGMVSFPAENTLLMEDLASKGMVVVSVCHRDELAEFKSLSEEQSQQQKKLGDQLTQALNQCQDPIKRSELSQQFFAASDVTNSVVDGRVEDLDVVTEKIKPVLSNIPDMVSSQLNLNMIGLLGYSLGGAVVSEFSKQRSTNAVINLDGGLFGWDRERSLKTPYLMIYSKMNEGCNQALLGLSDFVTQHVVNGTRHMDFHDANFVFPMLAWLRVSSKRSKIQINAERNRVVSEFFCKNLNALNQGDKKEAETTEKGEV